MTALKSELVSLMTSVGKERKYVTEAIKKCQNTEMFSASELHLLSNSRAFKVFKDPGVSECVEAGPVGPQTPMGARAEGCVVPVLPVHINIPTAVRHRALFRSRKQRSPYEERRSSYFPVWN